MAHPKPLSEKSLARLYQKSGLTQEQSEYLHSLFQACANLYGAVQLRVVWDVYPEFASMITKENREKEKKSKEIRE